MNPYQPTRIQLDNLFHAQTKLDNRIEDAFPRVAEDRLKLKILALLTEIGEALNEFREFKFWSRDRKRREKKLLPELVDILHFMLSIGLEVDCLQPDIWGLNEFTDPLDAFSELYMKTNGLLFFHMHGFDVGDQSVEVVFAAYYQLIESLGYTWADIEHAYNLKNEENHTRQETAY